MSRSAFVSGDLLCTTATNGEDLFVVFQYREKTILVTRDLYDEPHYFMHTSMDRATISFGGPVALG